MITLADAKLHCRVDGDAEDSLISRYIDAAKETISRQLNRNLYDVAVPADDEDGMVINAAIEAAILLLIGTWYANRESVQTGLQELPNGVGMLIKPYRLNAGL